MKIEGNRREHMRALMKSLIGLFALLLLASCGGGGGSDSNSANNPTGVAVAIELASATTTPNSLVGITVRVNNPNGPAVPNGTAVQMRVSPPGVGLVSQTTATGATVGEAVSSTTSGGIATFRLHSRAVGTATLTASVIDPFTPSRTVTANASVAVNAGPPSDPRLTIAATATSLPIRPAGVGVFLGSPYTVDVTLTQRTLDGALVTTGVDQFSVSINPVSIAAFSTLDDPTTEDINEIQVLLGGGPVDGNGGRGTVFVTSFGQAGTTTLSVTALDPQTGESVFATQVFTIVSGASGLPASVVMFADASPVFIQGVNGLTSKSVDVTVFDGAGGLITPPATGVNNVRVEIVGGAQGGESLQGPAGQTGAAIDIRTNNSAANFIYRSGTRAGPLTLRATADRADNNVDNGIQDGVTSTRQLSVGDGRLFDIDITTAQLSDPVGADVVNVGDGTYRFTISALATDRFGNPIPPGQEIRFGVFDEPQASGAFQITGGDGDPQELGTLFTAAGGAFTSAGGGAGPGDTLVLLTESTPNRDLEGARVVQSINSAGSLSVTYRFNANDTTGTSVNATAVPYIIGRAADANIDTVGVTDSVGLAAAELRYPRSKLGKAAIVWAQGSGDLVSGQAELVSDVEPVSFQGSGTLNVFTIPAEINANRSVPVQVCVTDGFQTPISGAQLSFAFRDLGAGTGSVNGVPGAGAIAQTTGANGCVGVTVITNGMTADGTLNFTSGTAIGVLDIVLPGTPTISVSPSSQGVVASGNTLLLVRVSDGGGGGLVGIQPAGGCTVAGGVGATITLGAIPATDAQGFSTFSVAWTGFTAGVTGTCTFTAAGVQGNAIALLIGGRACGDGFSPPPAGCVP
jgi:hypothetical protein